MGFGENQSADHVMTKIVLQRKYLKKIMNLMFNRQFLKVTPGTVYTAKK